MRRIFGLLAATLAGLGVAAAQQRHDEAGWSAWRAGIDREYAEDRLAILKAADVRYLKPGETVRLAAREDGTLKLSLETSGGDILSIAHEHETATLTRDGRAFDLLAFLREAGRYPISDRYDLVAGRQQIEKNVMGVRVVLFDQESAAAKAFGGARWFDYDPGFVVRATFHPAAEMTPRDIQTERGLWKSFYLAGTARIKIGAADFELPLYAVTDDAASVDYLFVSFTDETTGVESYSVGRYLDFRGFGKFPPKRLTVDFNRAYNPYCARPPHYNCPLALTHAPVALRAGEKPPELLTR